jgi:hypothetical protein
MADQARGANMGMAITTTAAIKAKAIRAFIMGTVYRFV